MHTTTTQDHVNRTGGTIFQPNAAEEMLSFIVEHKQLDVLKTIDIRNVNPQELMKQILGAFVETRRLYQILQPSKYSSYARDLI